MTKPLKSWLFPVKVGRRTVGGIYISDKGNELFLVNRKAGQINKGQAPTISDAIRDGTASWGIEEEALLSMRARGVKMVGVKVRDTGEVWLTYLDRFFDRANLSQPPRYLRGPMQRFLSINQFARRPGKIRL